MIENYMLKDGGPLRDGKKEVRWGHKEGLPKREEAFVEVKKSRLSLLRKRG